MQSQLLRWRRALLVVAAFVFTLAVSDRAHAYAWMIRHEYIGCAMCHADPSGGSLLTPYGLAQSEVLLRTRYDGKEGEPGKLGAPLLGLVDLPESLLVGADVRRMSLKTTQDGNEVSSQSFFMQADLLGQLTFDRFRVNGSVGYAEKGARPASLTHNPEGNWVSRSHWVGVDLGEDRNVTLRAGRINVPFGIRSIEHTLWVRKMTRTDSNSAQQHGVAISYNGEKWRGELMAVAGNLQLSPSDYREQGYVGFLEHTPVEKLAVGVSSQILHSAYDVQWFAPTYRHSHGLFARWSPTKMLVLSTEADYLFRSEKAADKTSVGGYAFMAQADVEPIQGVHVQGTYEAYRDDTSNAQDPAHYRQWLSVAWFFAPHVDVRLDGVWQSDPGPQPVNTFTQILQFHAFL